MTVRIETPPVLVRNGELDLARPVDWSYSCVRRAMTCLLNGELVPVDLRLFGDALPCVPDVDAIEWWFMDVLARPQTCESLALLACARWGTSASCTSLGTLRHGAICAVAHPPGEQEGRS